MAALLDVDGDGVVHDEFDDGVHGGYNAAHWEETKAQFGDGNGAGDGDGTGDGDGAGDGDDELDCDGDGDRDVPQQLLDEIEAPAV